MTSPPENGGYFPFYPITKTEKIPGFFIVEKFWMEYVNEAAGEWMPTYRLLVRGAGK
jgi:hypothetical protein